MNICVVIYNNNFNTPDTILVEFGVTVGRYRYGVNPFSYMLYLQKSQEGLLLNNYITDTIWRISGD